MKGSKRRLTKNQAKVAKQEAKLTKVEKLPKHSVVELQEENEKLSKAPREVKSVAKSAVELAEIETEIASRDEKLRQDGAKLEEELTDDELEEEVGSIRSRALAYMARPPPFKTQASYALKLAAKRPQADAKLAQIEEEVTSRDDTLCQFQADAKPEAELAADLGKKIKTFAERLGRCVTRMKSAEGMIPSFSAGDEEVTASKHPRFYVSYTF